ncbi:Pullulanase 1, chloroplastic [Tetrabaena socialis]|uniref:Pullulanase 1, chloroplastic n=1 Tax=Tetrabaena socialis TaxID=47790 RepID=A0A2J8ADA6_9CHLO|nr:Pullulanase 1, chloroplastic [Tetrabaena socialis]|eukprot:PNH10493.1 Pullulanase 1, chloroplastic [Tetrabaena socialis]
MPRQPANCRYQRQQAPPARLTRLHVTGGGSAASALSALRPWPMPGLVTGLALAPNPEAVGAGQPASLEAQRAELLVLSDWVRSALAGNLRKYPLHLCDGSTRTGEQAQAHGLPLAYGGLPCEHVPFIGCHDNKTVFDQVVEKAAATETAEERMRMCVLCLALVALSQGVPFVHAGDDLLRSKSLDRDSYNSDPRQAGGCPQQFHQPADCFRLPLLPALVLRKLAANAQLLGAPQLAGCPAPTASGLGASARPVTRP